MVKWELSAAAMAILSMVLNFANCEDYPSPFNCPDMGNYTTDSTYLANLNATLSSLSSNASQYGFYSAAVGQGDDRAHAVALCRADVLPDDCRGCVQMAAVGVLQSCWYRKQGIRWFEFCTVHYSNLPIRGTPMDGIGEGLIGEDTATNPVQFRQDRTALLDLLRRQAANGSSLKVGAGSSNTVDSDVLYALVQCFPTLSAMECQECLIQASQDLPRVLNRGSEMKSSCTVRYSVDLFYNETRLRELNVSISQIPNSSSGKGNNTGSKKDDNTKKIVISIAVAISVCLMLAACGAIFLRKRIRKMLQRSSESSEEIIAVDSLQFDFGRICKATDGFAYANKLGEGGFGTVYRGKLSNGQEIAVKKLLRGAGQGDKEFKNEVVLVARLQHRNLIRLLGFSMEGKERLLVYEFAPNASLDQFLFDPIKSSQLDWQKRCKIIIGIARGLLYLHEDSRLRIIHRDLKPGNILLDGELNPKIADFGMARLFGHDETQAETRRIVGTYGYMPPEYALHGKFSVKSDVFSFGVLVLEIVSGRKTGIRNGNNVEGLLNTAWNHWREGTAENVIDPVLKTEIDYINDMLRFIHIGLLCVQESPASRPLMNSVVSMLSRSSVTLPAATQIAFHVASSSFHSARSQENDLKSKGKTDASDAGSSQNEMSATDLHPR
ncbi:cysteine-rich receptor-like protein kinase 44 [Andrographis paniculata]|uniref:cysteine-rich receptor-like protein kinase 44 n=1 Tax=Andrographis paniculata TaxID=175694 RepID=UPI0021E759A3|nr:cysteine-rich receptor-like protein kinase 44 [Andrographis paniculata]